MLSFLLAAVLTIADWYRVRGNVGAAWNGYGALPGVLGRRGYGPMRYRVLMAWLFRLVAPILPDRMLTRLQYQALKGLILWAALAVSQVLLGASGVLLLALLLVLLMEFDYWSSYAELLALGLLLVGCRDGHLVLVVLGGIAWGLSKETALLAPVLGLLGGGLACGLAGLAGPVALIIVRRVQGKARLYCARWTAQQYNVPDLVAAWDRRDDGPFCSLAWSLATVWAMLVTAGGSGVLRSTAPAAGVWIVAGWLMARARETRVFMPTALWIAAAAAQVGLI